MKKKHLINFFITLFLPLIGFSQNPIIQTIFTADPAQMVYNDTEYLYNGHDKDSSNWFAMNDWRCHSSDNMVNLTDHGSLLSIKTSGRAKSDTLGRVNVFIAMENFTGFCWLRF